MAEFDKHWNYNDPIGTEQKFREVLGEIRASGNITLELELLTQIARTQGLQQKFDDAHATLDQVEARMDQAHHLIRTRYLLERGRTFNSSKQRERAIPLFTDAMNLAIAHKLDFYAIDPERTVTGWKDGNIGASSLYRADPAWPYEKYVQRTVRVSSLSLDHYCRSHRPPDLLWLDVQGAEHRVLAGAAGVLPSVKLLHVEVCFRPLYTGQSLFWQVHAMLRAQFRLVRLYGVRSRLLLRLNTRLNREKWFTDAVYINRRNDIPALRYSSRGFD
jgi:FkbM family methyltransferase